MTTLDIGPSFDPKEVTPKQTQPESLGKILSQLGIPELIPLLGERQNLPLDPSTKEDLQLFLSENKEDISELSPKELYKFLLTNCDSFKALPSKAPTQDTQKDAPTQQLPSLPQEGISSIPGNISSILNSSLGNIDTESGKDVAATTKDVAATTKDVAATTKDVAATTKEKQDQRQKDILKLQQDSIPLSQNIDQLGILSSQDISHIQKQSELQIPGDSNDPNILAQRFLYGLELRIQKLQILGKSPEVSEDKRKEIENFFSTNSNIITQFQDKYRDLQLPIPAPLFDTKSLPNSSLKSPDGQPQLTASNYAYAKAVFNDGASVSRVGATFTGITPDGKGGNESRSIDFSRLPPSLSISREGITLAFQSENTADRLQDSQIRNLKAISRQKEGAESALEASRANVEKRFPDLSGVDVDYTIYTLESRKSFLECTRTILESRGERSKQLQTDLGVLLTASPNTILDQWNNTHKQGPALSQENLLTLQKTYHTLFLFDNPGTPSACEAAKTKIYPNSTYPDIDLELIPQYLITSISEGIDTTNKLSNSLKNQRDQADTATNAFNEATRSLELKNSQMKESVNTQFETAQKNLDFYLKDLRVDRIGQEGFDILLEAVQENLQKTEAGIRFNPATTPLTESLKQTFKTILQKAIPDNFSFDNLYDNSEMPLASQSEMPLDSNQDTNPYRDVPQDNQGPFKPDGTLDVPKFRDALAR